MSDQKDRLSLGMRLKQRREYLGFSQEDVAGHLAVPRTAISQMESGNRRLDVIELRKLARLYQCSVAWFTGEEESETPQEIQMLAKAAAELSDVDKAQVLKFAEFLRTRSTEPGK